MLVREAELMGRRGAVRGIAHYNENDSELFVLTHLTAKSVAFIPLVRAVGCQHPECTKGAPEIFFVKGPGPAHTSSQHPQTQGPS